MSWLTKIDKAIMDGREPGEVYAVIQGAITEYGGKINAVVEAADPDDYAIILACMESTCAALRPRLNRESQLLADLIRKQTTSVCVVMPREKK